MCSGVKLSSFRKDAGHSKASLLRRPKGKSRLNLESTTFLSIHRRSHAEEIAGRDRHLHDASFDPARVPAPANTLLNCSGLGIPGEINAGGIPSHRPCSSAQIWGRCGPMNYILSDRAVSISSQMILQIKAARRGFRLVAWSNERRDFGSERRDPELPQQLFPPRAAARAAAGVLLSPAPDGQDLSPPGLQEQKRPMDAAQILSALLIAGEPRSPLQPSCAAGPDGALQASQSPLQPGPRIPESIS